MNDLYITILAAGNGKRMQSVIPKVLHQIKGEIMIVRLIKQALELNPAKIFIVVGKYKNLICEEIQKYITNDRIIFVEQKEPLGTGDAVKSTLSYFDENCIMNNIILNGDVPLLQATTIREIYDHYVQSQSNLLITAIHLNNPSGNGRIVIDNSGLFKEIIEEKDCCSNQKMINLVNVGIYIVRSDVLKECIPKIKNINASGEYYLTDLVKIYDDTTKQKVGLFILNSEKEKEIFNVNTIEQLQYLENNF